MAIETICKKCARKLSVADQYAGKRARCPQCGNVYEVPQKTGGDVDVFAGVDQSNPAAKAANVGSLQWSMKTPDGSEYGPVSKEELDQWLREGRISADCFLKSSATGKWQPAADVYQMLRSSSSRPTTGGQYVAGGAATNFPTSNNPFQDTQTGLGSYGTPPPGLEDHRGVLILILGMISWMACLIAGPCGISVSIVAITLGAMDLKKMNQGHMDPSGKTMTACGLWISIVQIVATILLYGFFLLFVLAAAQA